MSTNLALTGGQIRMARGYLRWSVAELARVSGVGISTIKRAELADQVPPITGPNLKAIRAALEDAGVRFLSDEEGWVGVRIRQIGRII